MRNANLIWSYENNLAISADKEQALVAELLNSDAAATPLNPDTPYVMPDAREWEILTEKRLAQREHGRHRSEREMEIEQKLKTPVSLQFEHAPLSDVLDHLAKLADVNLHLDPQGLAEEGVTTDTPVTIDLQPGDHAQERAEPDPRAAAPELRDQGRGAEDHQRADARRRGLHGDLQRGRPGDADSELRAQPATWAWPAPTTTP